jgi:transposase
VLGVPLLEYRRQPRLRLPVWEVRLMIAMYHEGITVREIAEAARVSTGTVYRYIGLVRAAQHGVDWLLDA